MRRAPHVPQRTCITCRRVGAKQELVRVVRTPQGEVRLDPTGKLGGRGAYVCRSAKCLEQAVKQRKLARALGVPISEEAAAGLQRVLRELTAQESMEEVNRAEHESS